MGQARDRAVLVKAAKRARDAVLVTGLLTISAGPGTETAHLAKVAELADAPDSGFPERSRASQSTEKTSSDVVPTEDPLDGHGADPITTCPIESALAEALKAAVAAQQWTVVGQLSKELEARRVARSASNVVELSKRRSR